MEWKERESHDRPPTDSPPELDATARHDVAMICLVAGIAGGWLLRGWQKPAATGSVTAASVSTTAVSGKGSTPQMPGAPRFEDMADAKAAPLLNKLKTNPDDPALLTSLGNLYYDAQQYPDAIQFTSAPSRSGRQTQLCALTWGLLTGIWEMPI